MRRISGQQLYLAGVVLASLVLIGYLAWPEAQAGPRRLSLKDIPFDGQQAYEYLKQLCDLGPRPSGSEAMTDQQELLKKHFEELGAEVELQPFRVRDPLSGKPVEMNNLLVHWHPKRQERVLLCAHYDTRPFPDNDPVRPRGTFIGANDGASGVAILMEMGRSLSELPGKLGVDFVLFDGEELVYDERGEYLLGSTHFARELVAHPPSYTYRWAVLLDMVGDADLQIYQEQNCSRWRETRPLLDKLWGTAKRLGVREFIARPRYEIKDDHLPLHDIAGIAACDVIDFNYPAWHTEGDVPSACSAVSLAKVGWVLDEWLRAAVK